MTCWMTNLPISEKNPYQKIQTIGTYAIRRHCVTFPQDITDICDTLPCRKESIFTFIRNSGNKETKNSFVKQLRVRKDYVTVALKWLNHHHTGYTDITIVEEFFDWMGGENGVNIVSE